MRKTKQADVIFAEMVEVEQPAPNEGELAPLPQKQGLAARWDGFKNRLPRMRDENQRRAGKNLLRLLIVLLVLTLVAKGTAGATLPVVQTGRAESGEIVQRVRGNGTVEAKDSLDVPVPEGLTVKELAVSQGQAVKEGDVLASFDLEELAEALQRQSNALQELQLKLRQLQRGEPHDASGLESVQRTLARAQQDYDSTAAQGNADLAAANQALAAAQAAQQAARELLGEVPDETSPEYQSWLDACEAVTNAQAAVNQTQSRVDGELLARQRALEDAQVALAGAQQADAAARQQAGDAAAQNKLEADTLLLDVEAQQKKLDALQALMDREGLLLAPGNGAVQALPQQGAKTGQGAEFRLSDTSGGYNAEMWLDKKDAEKLAPGGSCEVALAGGSVYYRPTAEGVITAIVTDEETGRTKVTVRLPQGDWKAGQTVDIQVVQSRQNHSLCVPLSALHADSDGTYVLVLEQQSSVLGLEYVAVKVPVTVTAQDEQMAAIEGNIGGWEEIITTASKAVQPGSKVRVAP